MRASRSGFALGVSAMVVSLFGASPTAAQSSTRAPLIRVYSENGPGVASRYVSPAITLNEDAYVFAVSIDLDGQIQVLQPEFPGISVRIAQNRVFRLPNFYAGFAERAGGSMSLDARYSGYSGYDQGFDSRGTVIALASRQPFNLARLESNGDWNMVTLRGLIDRQPPALAAQALASYIGAEGEPIGRDFMRFAPTEQSYYADNSLYSCDFFNGGYSTGLAYTRLSLINRVNLLQREGQNVRIVGYDYCGLPILAYGPSRGFRRNSPVPPRNPGDTLNGHRRLFPRTGPKGDPSPRAAFGFFPITRTAQPVEPGKAANILSMQPRDNPGEVLIDRRGQERPAVSPQRNSAPIGTLSVPNRPATGTVSPPPQMSRPAPRETPAPPPRVEPTRSAPPPPRVEQPRVEQTRSSPPPARAEPRSPPPASSPPPRASSSGKGDHGRR
jgi:hypothetical protein